MDPVWNNDLELVQQACKGDRNAFREIVESNRKKIFYFAYDLTGSYQDAEDLSQDVFLKAFRSLKKFRGEASLSSWFYRITLNTFLDQKRKLSFTAEKKQQQLDDQQIREISLNSDNPGSTPENFAESRQIKQHIEQALTALTPKERSVFVMRHYQGMPVKEVAGILNISGGTVKSFLFRAIKKLQKELDFYETGIDKNTGGKGKTGHPGIHVPAMKQESIPVEEVY